MSIRILDDDQKNIIAHLQSKLHKREYHLAELINEVVYAEEERFRALQEAHSLREFSTRLESVITKLLEYNITIHREVLLPVLTSPTATSGERCGAAASPQDPTSVTSLKRCLCELLSEPHLSSETKTLLREVGQKRQDIDPVRGGNSRLHHNPAIPSDVPSDSDPRQHPKLEKASAHNATHQAIVLTSSLLKNQETLAQLLKGLQTQAKDLLHRWNRLDTMALQDRPQQTIPDSDDQRQKHNREIAPFQRETKHQHGSSASENVESNRFFEVEPDASQVPLGGREAAAPGGVATVTPTAIFYLNESWTKERAELQQELAHTRQHIVQEQALSRELRRRISQLEASAIAPVVPSTGSLSTCAHCEKMRIDMNKALADYEVAKISWRAEKQCLENNIASLRLQVKKTANEASLSAKSPSADALADEYPRNLERAASKRKIGELEATVAALKADLHIMEMRMSVMLEEKDSERRRILAAHERERQRLCDEKEEYQRIINSMSRELQGLSGISASTPPAITSIAG